MRGRLIAHVREAITVTAPDLPGSYLVRLCTAGSDAPAAVTAPQLSPRLVWDEVFRIDVQAAPDGQVADLAVELWRTGAPGDGVLAGTGAARLQGLSRGVQHTARVAVATDQGTVEVLLGLCPLDFGERSNPPIKRNLSVMSGHSTTPPDTLQSPPLLNGTLRVVLVDTSGLVLPPGDISVVLRVGAQQYSARIRSGGAAACVWNESFFFTARLSPSPSALDRVCVESLRVELTRQNGTDTGEVIGWQTVGLNRLRRELEWETWAVIVGCGRLRIKLTAMDFGLPDTRQVLERQTTAQSLPSAQSSTDPESMLVSRHSTVTAMSASVLHSPANIPEAILAAALQPRPTGTLKVSVLEGSNLGSLVSRPASKLCVTVSLESGAHHSTRPLPRADELQWGEEFVLHPTLVAAMGSHVSSESLAVAIHELNEEEGEPEVLYADSWPLHRLPLHHPTEQWVPVANAAVHVVLTAVDFGLLPDGNAPIAGAGSRRSRLRVFIDSLRLTPQAAARLVQQGVHSLALRFRVGTTQLTSEERFLIGEGDRISFGEELHVPVAAFQSPLGYITAQHLFVQLRSRSSGAWATASIDLQHIPEKQPVPLELELLGVTEGDAKCAAVSLLITAEDFGLQQAAGAGTEEFSGSLRVCVEEVWGLPEDIGTRPCVRLCFGPFVRQLPPAPRGGRWRDAMVEFPVVGRLTAAHELELTVLDTAAGHEANTLGFARLALSHLVNDVTTFVQLPLAGGCYLHLSITAASCGHALPQTRASLVWQLTAGTDNTPAFVLVQVDTLVCSDDTTSDLEPTLNLSLGTVAAAVSPLLNTQTGWKWNEWFIFPVPSAEAQPLLAEVRLPDLDSFVFSCPLHTLTAGLLTPVVCEDVRKQATLHFKVLASGDPAAFAEAPHGPSLRVRLLSTSVGEPSALLLLGRLATRALLLRFSRNCFFPPGLTVGGLCAEELHVDYYNGHRFVTACSLPLDQLVDGVPVAHELSVTGFGMVAIELLATGFGIPQALGGHRCLISEEKPAQNRALVAEIASPADHLTAPIAYRRVTLRDIQVQAVVGRPSLRLFVALGPVVQILTDCDEQNCWPGSVTFATSPASEPRRQVKFELWDCASTSKLLCCATLQLVELPADGTVVALPLGPQGLISLVVDTDQPPGTSTEGELSERTTPTEAPASMSETSVEVIAPPAQSAALMLDVLYLAHHRIDEIYSKLLESLLEYKPPDPISHLLGQLQNL